MTTYTPQMLDAEAKIAAKAHARASGGGRPMGVRWNLVITAALAGPSLSVGYYCNRPNGECEHYATSVAI